MVFKEQYWHQLFETGVFLKAVNSLWETLGGLFILSTVHHWAGRFFIELGNTELLGDRDDVLFHFATAQLAQLTVSTRTFIGAYLLFHGILNAFLAYNLFKERLWAFPVCITFTSVFLLYQVYRFTHTHSLILLAITIFDLGFIVLTWHEYKHQQKVQHQATV